MTTRAVSLLICALGGEGGGVLSEWLVEAALLAGYPVQSTSIPGVAQRTGATTYYVEIFPVQALELGARKPVLSLYPVPGELDLIVSSELLETVRQVQNGMADPGHTRVLSSSSRTLTTNERMQMADGRLGQDELESVIAAHSLENQIFDMTALALRCETVVSAVMFGAVAASGALPFGRQFCEAAIRAQGKGTDKSLRGFSEAFATVERLRSGISARTAIDEGLVQAAPIGSVAPVQSSIASRQTPPGGVASRFPASMQEIVSLGLARVTEYQDGRYGELYLERLERILAAEERALAGSEPAPQTTRPASAECARYLALWMAFDDIVRVAELKARRSRRERVRAEVKAKPAEHLRLYDFFKPGLPEIAGMMPPALAKRLLRVDQRRQLQGKEALAFPIQIASSRLWGMAMLRLLVGMKWIRRLGLRFQEEQRAIESWLGAIEQGLSESPRLGFELAACGRLIKGYGATNERGKHNLMHLVNELAQLPGIAADARAGAIADAREAALKDDAGSALDRTLVQQGAKPRPVKAVPLRFQRRVAQNEMAVEQVKRRA